MIWLFMCLTGLYLLLPRHRGIRSKTITGADLFRAFWGDNNKFDNLL